ERDVNPEYFSTLRAKLLRGRSFTNDDLPQRPRVAVINEAFARRYFPGEDPLGRTIANTDLNPQSARKIVGVVGNLREGALDEDIWPSEYQPLYQSSDTYFSVVVRTSQDERSILPTLVLVLRGIDPNLGVYGEATMADQIEATPSSLMQRF